MYHHWASIQASATTASHCKASWLATLAATPRRHARHCWLAKLVSQPVIAGRIGNAVIANTTVTPASWLLRQAPRAALARRCRRRHAASHFAASFFFRRCAARAAGKGSRSGAINATANAERGNRIPSNNGRKVGTNVSSTTGRHQPRIMSVSLSSKSHHRQRYRAASQYHRPQVLNVVTSEFCIRQTG